MSKLMGSSSLALVQEYKKQQARLKQPIHQPRSIDLMAQLFSEIIEKIAEIKVTPSIELDQDSVSIIFKAARHQDAVTLREMLRSLDEECELDGIEVNPLYYCVTADDHLTMHQLLAVIVMNNDDLVVPEKAQPPHVIANTPENKQGYIDLKSSAADFKRAHELVISKSYGSRDEYEAAVYMASKANLSVSLNHIYSCIFREQGQHPKENQINPGGYH